MFWKALKVWQWKCLPGLSKKACLDYKLIIKIVTCLECHKWGRIYYFEMFILRCHCSIEVKLYKLWGHTTWFKWVYTQTSIPQFCHLWNGDNSTYFIRILSKLSRWLYVKVLEQCWACSKYSEVSTCYFCSNYTTTSTTTSADVTLFSGALKQNSDMRLFSPSFKRNSNVIIIFD